MSEEGAFRKFQQDRIDAANEYDAAEAARHTRALVEQIKNAHTEAADAARYRWLRAHAYIELDCDSPRVDGWKPEHLDAKVDERLARGESQGASNE